MSSLIQLHAVAPASLAQAMDFAMEYRGKLPVVWIVAENRNGRYRVCAPCWGGNVTRPECHEKIEFINYDGEMPEPYFTIVFGPGVLKQRKEIPCREKSKAATG